MPLSEKTKNRLLAPLAISPIMRKSAIPGVLGMLVVAIGFGLQSTWLKVVGLVLAAPMIWVYFVIIFIFLPAILFDTIRKSLRRSD